MKVEKFAKVFNIRKYGQILITVYDDTDDETGDDVRVLDYAFAPHPSMDVCHAKFSFSKEADADKSFRLLRRKHARAFCKSQIDPIREAFAPEAAQ